MSINLKKIDFNKSNFNYYFKIIFIFRNNLDYLQLTKLNNVSIHDSYHWLVNPQTYMIFYLIKYNLNFPTLTRTYNFKRQIIFFGY